MKVVKLIVVADDDTAAHIADLAEMPVKERDLISDRIVLERAGVHVELHFVHAEVVYPRRRRNAASWY